MISLTSGLFSMFLARVANLRVEIVSSMNPLAGVMVQMMAVLALPPSEGCKILVSFESL